MSLAPWRSHVARALHRNRSDAHSRYLQLATVRPNGQPANRTIVFRDYLDSHIDTSQNTLAFITDLRSAKVEQIQHQPWGEACWYFSRTREQFRLGGALQVVDAGTADPALQQARQGIWQSLSDRARQQFTWPKPGTPKADPASFEAPPPAAEAPDSQYALLVLTPQTVVHLELRGTPQNRTVYIFKEQQWQAEAVNP